MARLSRGERSTPQGIPTIRPQARQKKAAGVTNVQTATQAHEDLTKPSEKLRKKSNRKAKAEEEARRMRELLLAITTIPSMGTATTILKAALGGYAAGQRLEGAFGGGTAGKASGGTGGGTGGHGARGVSSPRF